MNQSESLEQRDHWDYLDKIKIKVEKINYVIKQSTALLHYRRFIATASTVLQWNVRFAKALGINISSPFLLSDAVIYELGNHQLFSSDLIDYVRCRLKM